MNGSSITKFDRDVSREELVARAQAMIPKLRELQERTEADRRVSDNIFQERRELSKRGIVTAIFPINKLTGELNAPPLLASTGVLNIENTPAVLDICSQELMRSFKSNRDLGNSSVNELQHYRKILGYSLYEQTGQRPLIQTVVVPN